MEARGYPEALRFRREFKAISLSSSSCCSAWVVVCGLFFFFQAEDGIRDIGVTGVQTCALPIFGPNPRSVALPGDRGIEIFGAVATLSRLLAFAVALVLAALLYLLLQRTRLGTAIRAVAANDTGAQLVGIATRRIYMLTFAIGTACRSDERR